ncbi:hypothetical protein JZU71_02405 [bacterium]|nr:hypothetical protein [bacterium]
MFVPTEEGRELGYAMKQLVEARWRPPKNYYHLTSGGHVRAIGAHVHNTVFAHLDIQDFFGHINTSRVTRWLKPLLGYAKAREFAKASTVAHPEHGGAMLPFGFVQSPILASLCLFHSALGRCLVELPHKLDVIVSVYMDDIILSAADHSVLEQAVKLIDESALRSGFPLHPDKREDPAPAITAFNIALAHQSLQIEEARWNSFRSSFQDSENEFVRKGIHSYVRSINLEQANRLLI